MILHVFRGQERNVVDGSTELLYTDTGTLTYANFDGDKKCDEAVIEADVRAGSPACYLYVGEPDHTPTVSFYMPTTRAFSAPRSMTRKRWSGTPTRSYRNSSSIPRATSQPATCLERRETESTSSTRIRRPDSWVWSRTAAGLLSSRSQSLSSALQYLFPSSTTAFTSFT